MKKLLIFCCSIIFVCAGCCAKKTSVSFEEAKNLLNAHSLVVYYADGSVKTYDDGGIIPLFKHLKDGDFKGTVICDKVTGKASSAVLAYGKAETLHTKILSKEAIPMLEKYGIKYSADEVVDYILNKAGNGKCPMEMSVENTDNPEEAYKILKEKFDK